MNKHNPYPHRAYGHQGQISKSKNILKEQYNSLQLQIADDRRQFPTNISPDD